MTEPNDTPTILVIDDDQALVEIIEISLRMRQMDTIGRNDPRRAVREAAHLAWDAALVDVHMPGLDGYAVLRTLKAIADRPVILMSGAATASDATRHGADGFIAKPFSVDELADTVREHISQGTPVR